MEIRKRLQQDIRAYCDINGLDEDEFLNDMVRKALMRVKYGDRPSIYGVSAQYVDSERVDPEPKVVTFTLDIEPIPEKKPKKKSTTPKKAKETKGEKKNASETACITEKQVYTLAKEVKDTLPPTDNAVTAEEKPKRRKLKAE